MGRQGRRVALAVLAGLAAAPGLAGAQTAPAAAAGARTGLANPYGSMYANPYANPYTNPFLNPYMTQGPAVQGNPALYLFAAQQAAGGIGSGRISGTRPARPSSAPVPDVADPKRASDTPGGTAAQFFNRGGRTAASTGRYYNRAGRYYRANTH